MVVTGETACAENTPIAKTKANETERKEMTAAAEMTSEWKIAVDPSGSSSEGPSGEGPGRFIGNSVDFRPYMS